MVATVAREIHRTVTDRSTCEFYHVMDFPDGFVSKEAQWDLRKTADDYLGGVDVAGKSVLEIGPASGFLSLHMERNGAQVTCIEPPMDTFWDIVPYANIDLQTAKQGFMEHIERIRNSFWYAHQAFGSKVRLFEADAYRLPESLGTFDIGLLAAVLLHCSCPVQMIASVARRVKKTIIVTDLYWPDLGDQPVCRLHPDTTNTEIGTWWHFSPQFVVQYLAVLGFTDAAIRKHRQQYTVTGAWADLFTVVATRPR